ncbi:MAG: DUF3369 domain-containing protein [Campylobacteraceae bacterium]|nr:DUF3369 domain-containing protein [Campylobacteraceae bacterium]
MPKLTFNDKKEIKLNDDAWEMLVVDDEEEVHSITKSVLKKLVFDNKILKFHHAYNATEAINIIKNNKNIALILLDVVMENNEAGLNVVKNVREELKNDLVRIILRTGQPGSAPEKDIILNYDINDYKEKTELTSTKLYTSVITALRSYKELASIRDSKLGLEKILESNKIIYEQQSFLLMVENIIIELNNFINIGRIESLGNQEVSFIKFENNVFEVVNALDTNEDNSDNKDLYQRAIETRKNVIRDDYFIAYLEIDDSHKYLLHINNYLDFSDIKQNLLLIFLSNISVALKNLFLHHQVVESLDYQKKELEAKVKEAVHEVTKKDKLIQQQSRLAQLGEMISMIAHQWRQPLNAIAANAIGIETKLSLWEDDEDMLTKEGQIELHSFVNSKLNNIERYVQSLSMTIDNFRDFYKPTKEKRLVTINNSIKQALDIVETSMQTKLIKINKEFNSTIELELFTHELMQVILNLLKNSQDNFEEKNIEEAKISIITNDIKNGIRVEIIDNGGGIPNNISAKIFDPYFSTKSEKNGTGLGLYMSKLIIEEHHNGKLQYKNTQDGVCFTIEIYI